ncbi:Six-bladed beta-propeller TolB-like protein [Lasiodiplodia theobromae]|nr:Six-bladed beta-propeller TolB-like protein [Lasiodiplodia theobromae]
MPIDGSWSVWSLDLRGWVPSADNNSQQIPSVSRISAVPEAKMLNGIAVLNPATTTGPRAKGNDSEPLLLLADSTRGIIYSIDVAASNSSTNVFYSNPDLLAPTADAAFPTGLNGLQLPPVRNPKHVYFTTGFRGTFFRLELSQTSPAVAPAAEPELLAKGYENLDDFALDADGTAYLSTSVAREIVRVTPSGEETVIFQGDLVSSGTATLLVERDGKKILYVNTGSASNFGDGIPGKLVEIWL